MKYTKVGEIVSVDSIQWDTHVIVTGSICGSNAWFQRVPGVFRRDNDNFRFVSDHGTSFCFRANDSISLNLLAEGGE